MNEIQRATRRDVLKKIAALAGGAAVATLAVGCDLATSSPSESRTPVAGVPGTLGQPKLSDQNRQKGASVQTPLKPKEQAVSREAPRERIMRIIRELPESPIKRAFMSRALKYFQAVPPTITLGGVDMALHGVTVEEYVDRERSVRGRFNIRDQSMPQGELLHTIDDITIRFPLVGFSTTPGEDTYFFPLTIPRQAPFYQGLSPRIVLTTPDASRILSGQQQVAKDVEDFMFLKETAGLLLMDIWIDQIAQKMREMGVNPYVNAKNIRNEQVKAELISNTIYQMVYSESPMNKLFTHVEAAIDLAEYLIALKAFEGTDILKNVPPTGKEYTDAISLLSQIDLGNNDRDILLRSLQTVRDKEAFHKFIHRGNLKQPLP